MSKYVELETHVGIHLLTKKEVVHDQYFVYLTDDKNRKRERIGLIGTAEGSKLVFTSKVDPVIKDWIIEEVSLLLNKESVESVDPPVATQEALAVASQGSEEDELNEKDLT